jgi:urease accessory protein
VPLDDAPVGLQRADGEAHVAFKLADGATRLDVLHQSGESKIRFPLNGPGAPPEAVFINTAGGMTGGDRFQFGVTLGAGTRAIASSQAAERIYRSVAGPVTVRNTLAVGAGADLAWLPQETILFDRSALDRRLEIDLAPDARLLAAETIVFGRTARGEVVRETSVTDAWRVTRAGKLVWADTLAIDGDADALLARRATGAGAVASATVLLVAPDGPARLDDVRALLETDTGVEAGASAWEGLLVARLLSADARALRDRLMALVVHLSGRPMPRVWRC